MLIDVFDLSSIQGLRKLGNRFVTFKGPRRHARTSKPTIARWLGESINSCYEEEGLSPLQEVRGNYTRPMAASWAERGQVRISSIYRAASWRAPHTYTKHYRPNFVASKEIQF